MKWKDADWPLFTERLEREHVDIRTIYKEQRLEKNEKQLYCKINFALDKACPMTKK